jgi:beta-phosphoglucomutase
MIKGVIFDMDGVVVDSHPSHMRVWRKFLLSKGRSVTDAELEFIRDGRKKAEILRYFFGDLTDDQVQAYGDEKDRLFQEEVQNLQMIAGVQQLLDELQSTGIPIALASSGSSRRVHNILDSLRLRDYFATVVTGDDVAIGKPHPAIFRKAAEQLQIQPFESLVFEDSVSGVQAAKAAGMKCLGIADHHRATALQQAGAERVFLNFLHASLGQIQKSLLEIQ